MSRYFLVIFTLSIYTIQNTFYNAYSQSYSYKIENISLEKGISNNLIFSIYQDSRGFIWFGTMFGLVRYDGVNYKTFRHNPKDTNTISNDDVISVYEDKDGNIWVGTYMGGLNKYNRGTGKFSRYMFNPDDKNSISSNTVWSILQDRSGVMWFGTETGGLNKYENNIFTAYRYDSTNQSSIGSNSVYALAEDKEGNIWAGTAWGGLNRFEKQTNSFTRYKRDKDDSTKISGNFIRSLYADKDGNIWAGTLNRGLNKYDKNTGKFIQYFNNSDDGDTSLARNSIFSIKEDITSKDNLLVSTGSGLYKLDLSSKQFTRIGIFDKKLNKTENIITSLTDNSGVVWFSIYYDGLYKMYPSADKFFTLSAGEHDGKNLSGRLVSSLHEDIYGNIWIGTDQGLNKINSSNGIISYYDNALNSQNLLSSNKITSICSDSEGNIFTGTDNGLNIINGKTGKIELLKNNINDNNSISSNFITKIIRTKNNNIWIGTSSGLNKYEQGTKSFKRFINNPGDTNSISENTILSLYEDKALNLWIGTYGGLNKLAPGADLFNRYRKIINDSTTLSNNYIFSFEEDSKGILWIGTGGGLNKFNVNTGKFSSILEKDGLPNTVICGIIEDNSGNLWLSTKKGISKFNPAANTFVNYSHEDGLQGNMFIEGSYLKTTGGDLIFGGTEGLTRFSPSNIKERGFIPPVILTTLTKYKDNIVTEYDISGSKEIELNYDENTFTLEFASIDYVNPSRNKYAYMLEGFEENWRYQGNTARAIYTNIEPGSYKFKVIATNSDGIWNNEGTSVIIVIKPPFWKTWWFYLLCVFFIVLAAVLLQNRRVKQKVKTLLDIEKAKETEREIIREQSSRDYHDELGHKLTRISIHSKRIKKKLGSSANGIANDLTGIVDTSQSLQSGAKDLIWSLNPQEDTLYDFAVRLKDFGNEIFDDTGINFSMNGIIDDFKNVRLSMQNKRHLIFIFKEAMNNALKYSDCKSVTVTIKLINNNLEIILEDDGTGFILTDDLKGYGLKNIYSRTKKVNGNVDIISGINKGTKIKFNIGV